MIPKVIHYCWFGNNPLPDEAKKCIESWKKYCKDYKIVEWNETNYDINKCEFIKKAYENKKWAFVSDYARLDIIYENGGIYLDTDVEILRPIDDLLENEAFMGFERKDLVNTGLGFGAVAKNKFIKENLEAYNKLEYPEENIEVFACTKITTSILKKHGININNTYQKNDELGITLYPTEYFCPMNYFTGKINITDKTYSIHRYDMTWFSEEEKKWYLREQKLSRIFGIKLGHLMIVITRFPIKLIKRLKEKGIKVTIKHYLNKFKRKGRKI